MRLAWDCLRAGGTAVVVGLAAVGRRGGLPGHRVPLRQGHQGLLLRQRQPVGGARLAGATGGRRAARLADVVTNLTDLDGIPDGPRAPAARRGRPHRRDHRQRRGGRRAPSQRRPAARARARRCARPGCRSWLRTCATRSLRSQRERVSGCVEITIRSASKRSSASRTAANGTMSPTVPLQSRPSDRSTASVRSSRSCAASIAPACDQVSPARALPPPPARRRGTSSCARPRSAAARRAAPRLRRSRSRPQARGTCAHLREDCAANATTARGRAVSGATRPGRRRTTTTASTMAPIRPQTSNGKPSTPLADEHEHDRSDDREPDDPHGDLAELRSSTCPPGSSTAHMLSSRQPPALLTCRPLRLEVGDDLRAVVALDLDHAVDDAAARAAQALELARQLGRLRGRGAADRRHGLALAPGRLAPHAQDAVARGAPGLRRGTAQRPPSASGWPQCWQRRTRPPSVE